MKLQCYIFVDNTENNSYSVFKNLEKFLASPLLLKIVYKSSVTKSPNPSVYFLELFKHLRIAFQYFLQKFKGNLVVFVYKSS